jgi:hypothetical protein
MEMEINELRIGNWVKTDNEFQLTPNHWYDMGWGVFDFNQIEPIPLTEEWLVKFGFEKNYSYSEYSSFYDKNNRFRIESYKDGVIWFCDLCEIKSVHQFQNLYFALTEQELKVK